MYTQLFFISFSTILYFPTHGYTINAVERHPVATLTIYFSHTMLVAID